MFNLNFISQMKKKIFSAALLFAFTLATTSTFVSCKDYDDDINALRTEITTNATTLTSLVNEKVDNLTTEISTLKSQQSSLESAYKAADEKLQSAITSAKTDAEAYADVQAAAAQKAAIEASQTALDNAISSLEAAIKEANQLISDVDAKYDEKVSSLINADAALQTAIDEAMGKIAAAQTTATAALDQANANSTAISGNTTAIESNKTAIETLNTNLAKVESDLKSQISILTDELKTTNQTIAANKAAVDAQIDQVNSLIKTNADAITALQGADAEMLKKIESNSTELATLAAELALVDGKLEANLEAAKAYTDAQLASLKSELGVAIDKVAADVAAAVIRIQAAENKIAALEQFQSEQTVKNEELDSAIKALDEKVDANFDTYEKYVAATAETILALQDADKKQTESLDSIKSVVDNLQSTVKNALSDAGYNSLAELLAKVNANSSNISSNTDAIKELQQKLSDLTNAEDENSLEYRLKALEDYYGILSGDAGKIQNFTKDIAGLRTDVDNANEKVDALVAALNEAFVDPNEPAVTSDLTTSITDAINSAKTTIMNRLSAMDKEIEDLWKAIGEDYEESYAEFASKANSEIARLSGDVRQLKSLVFSPTEYYGGIETIGMYTITYNDFTGFADADLTKDQVNADNVTPSATATDVMPLAYASYYLNPSNAAVDLDKSHWSFIVNQATTHKDTRAISANDITVDSVANNSGLVNVYFSMSQDALGRLSASTTKDKIDVAALRYTYKAATGDTVITSDFAALREYEIDSLILNKVVVEGDVEEEVDLAADVHLCRTAKEAIEDEDTIAIAYNSTGVDLDKWINVHYNIENNHETWGGQATVNKKNFEIRYELIGYIAGTNNTNESAHATITGSMLTVHKYNQPTVAGGKEIVGRKPLIRVTLVDKSNNDKIAAYGYICAKIVTSTEVIPAVVMPENNDRYYLGCYDAVNHEQTTTWLDIEDALLDSVDISKSDFELLYSLETEADEAGDQTAVLYSRENGTYVKDTEDLLGRVDYSDTDKEGHKTNILTWTVSGDQAYKNFVTNNKSTMEVYVRFVSKAGDQNTSPIYVKLSWNPNGKININTKPAASIDNSDKKAANWHAKDSRNAGYAEVHMQIGDPTTQDNGGQAEFNQLTLANVFNSTISDIVATDLKTAGYEALAANSNNVEFVFAENQDVTSYTIEDALEENKTTYKIVVDNDDATYSYIYAYDASEDIDEDDLDDDDIIVKMKKADGTIEIDQDNEIAQALINQTDVRTNVKAGDVLTLTIGINVTACSATEEDAAAGTPITIDMSGTNRFNVKVIKPLYVESIDVDDMQWNDNITLTQDVWVSFTDFVGYNAGTYAQHSSTSLTADSWKWFYDFYEIEKVAIDEDEAITNYSGTWKKIDTNDFTISFSSTEVTIPSGVTDVEWDSPYTSTTNNTGAIAIGEVTLKQQNQERTNAFDIKIPVTVTYALGELTEYIPVHVKASK